MAHKEPVSVLTFDGEEFIFSQADDLDRDVESLRNSQTFPKLVEESSQCTRIPLSEIEREIDEDLSKKKETV